MAKEQPQKSNWQFYSSMEKLEELFEKFQYFAIHGATTNDKYGHSEVISYRIRPQQLLIHNKIIESLPDGWFKGKSDFHRKKDMIGTECLLNLLVTRNIVDPKTVNKYSQMLIDMNAIARKEHEASLNEEIDELIKHISIDGMTDSGKVLSELKEIRENVVKLNDDRNVRWAEQRNEESG